MGEDNAGMHRGNRQPAHQVVLTRPFYLSRSEVTQGQYQAVTGANPSNRKGADLPVSQVSWRDAVSFCAKLSAKAPGRTYRLPTEAEWEYACRAGSKTHYYWGDTFDPRFAWCMDNAIDRPKPVETRQPNAWGLYDMAGNVFEWCHDYYGPYQAGKQVDPKGPARGFARVVRGGSWDYGPSYCQSRERTYFGPDLRMNNCGFRVACDVPGR